MLTHLIIYSLYEILYFALIDFLSTVFIYKENF